MTRRIPWLSAAFVATLVPFAPAADPKPVKALLVVGGCCHDYAKQKDLICKGISGRANVQWGVSYDADKTTKHLNPIYEKGDWAAGYDVIVHDECSADVKDPAVVARILQPHKDGVPGVVLHCGMHSYRSEGYPKATPWFDFTGLVTTRHDMQAPIEVKFADTENPITKGMADWKTVNEELYNNAAGTLQPTARPLAKGVQTVKTKDGKTRTDEFVVAWTNVYDSKAKVFATTLGHNNDTVADPKYLDLVARGLLWSAGKLDADHLKPAKAVYLDGHEPK